MDEERKREQDMWEKDREADRKNTHAHIHIIKEVNKRDVERWKR